MGVADGVLELISFYLPSVLFLIASIGVYLSVKRPKGAPPGPTGLPYVGYIPFIGKRPQDTFNDLAKKYGNIFSVFTGRQLTVVLNDYDAMKAALVDNADAFANRDPGLAHQALNASPKDGRIRGLTMSNGDQWRTVRRFALATLRDLGMGKSQLQERMLDEISHLCDILRNSKGQPINPNPILVTTVANVMFAVTFDKRFDHGDQTLRDVMDYITVSLPALISVGPLQLLPWLRYIPGKMKRSWDKFVADYARVRRTFQKELVVHAELAKSVELKDYVTAFLKRQAEDVQNGVENSYFDDDELVTDLGNLFGAGTETTSSTITWSHYFLLLHPEIQQRIHDEIDANVGRDRTITMDDRTKLNYLQAFICEVQRLGHVAPMGIARSTTQEVEVLGYIIPKRTFVLANMWYAHRNPKHWPNPEQFIPERFLDAEGRLNVPPHFVPFCIGRRHCPGESLAKMEVFLVVANILQKFNLKIPPGQTMKSPDQYIAGITVRPEDFDVIFEPRT